MVKPEDVTPAELSHHRYYAAVLVKAFNHFHPDYTPKEGDNPLITVWNDPLYHYLLDEQGLETLANDTMVSERIKDEFAELVLPTYIDHMDGGVEKTRVPYLFRTPHPLVGEELSDFLDTVARVRESEVMVQRDDTGMSRYTQKPMREFMLIEDVYRV